MSLLKAKVNVNNTANTPVSNPTTPSTPATSPQAAVEPQPSQPAAPVETTASTPEKAAYVWDPVAARDIIVAKRDEGVITLTPNADGTAYTVTGDTKKVRGYLKGLNAKWDNDTLSWTLPAIALTDPTKASEERNAIVADRNAIREAKRAERAAAAPAKPATKKAEPKKTATKAEIKKADAAAKQPALKGAKTTYDITEVQQLIAAAVKTALSMVAATANNEKAITAIVAKILNDPRNAVGLTA